MASLPLPFSLTTRCRPTVPPAPGRLKTWTAPVMLSSSMTLRRGARGRVVAAAGGVGDHDLQVRWRAAPPAAPVAPARVVLLRGRAAGREGEGRDADGDAEQDDLRRGASAHR